MGIWRPEAWLLVLNIFLPSCVTLAMPFPSLSFNSLTHKSSVGWKLRAFSH